MRLSLDRSLSWGLFPVTPCAHLELQRRRVSGEDVDGVGGDRAHDGTSSDIGQAALVQAFEVVPDLGRISFVGFVILL